jgi:F-type H+-transporting ATPase subunit delta
MAREQNAVDAWVADLGSLRDLVLEPTVAQYLQSANVDEAAKFQIIDQGLEGAASAVRNLAKLLTRKRRTAIADQVVDAFEEMVNAERGIALATVTTAQALDDAGRQAVMAAVRSATGASNVNLTEQVDREILGGAIIRMGDHIIDGSVRTRLGGLKRNIAGSIS